MCALAVMPPHLPPPSILPVNGKQTHQRCDEMGRGHGMGDLGQPHAQAGWPDAEHGHGVGTVWDGRRLSTEASHPRPHT